MTRPGLRLLLLALALPALTTGVSVGLAAEPTASRDTVVGPSTLRAGTYNIRSGVSVGDFKSAIDTMKQRADLIGLQEIGLNDKNKYLKKDVDWGYYRPPAVQQNPVIWRRDLFDVLGTRGYLLTQGRDLNGELGPKPDEDDNWATVVRLRERATGREFSYINVHFVHGALKGGKPAPGRPRTFALLVDQIKAAVGVVKAERAISPQVFIGGDFNVSYKADLKTGDKRLPIKQFTKLAMTSMWKGSTYLSQERGTKGTALLDQIWTTATPSSVSIERDLKVSDHHPARADYDLAVVDGYTSAATGTIGFARTALAIQECNKPYQHPTFRIPVDLGSPEVGYVRTVSVVPGTAELSAIREIDVSALYDDDPSTDTITVEINPDKVAQGDRTFEVRLIGPVNATLVPGQEVVTATILDDDSGEFPRCKAPGK